MLHNLKCRRNCTKIISNSVEMSLDWKCWLELSLMIRKTFLTLNTSHLWELKLVHVPGRMSIYQPPFSKGPPFRNLRLSFFPLPLQVLFSGLNNLNSFCFSKFTPLIIFANFCGLFPVSLLSTSKLLQQDVRAQAMPSTVRKLLYIGLPFWIPFPWKTGKGYKQASHRRNVMGQ